MVSFTLQLIFPRELTPGNDWIGYWVWRLFRWRVSISDPLVVEPIAYIFTEIFWLQVFVI
jgi:hypothetical protein